MHGISHTTFNPFKKSEIEELARRRSREDLSNLPITLILDNVRQPDNLGAILRVASAIGVRRVLLLKGCVDAWQRKTLRAAGGAHFHLPIFTGIQWETIHDHLPDYPQVVLADLVQGGKASNFLASPRRTRGTLLNQLSK